MLVLGIKEKSMAWHRVCQDDTHGLVFKTKLQKKIMSLFVLTSTHESTSFSASFIEYYRLNDLNFMLQSERDSVP